MFLVTITLNHRTFLMLYFGKPQRVSIRLYFITHQFLCDLNFPNIKLFRKIISTLNNY